MHRFSIAHGRFGVSTTNSSTSCFRRVRCIFVTIPTTILDPETEQYLAKYTAVSAAAAFWTTLHSVHHPLIPLFMHVHVLVVNKLLPYTGELAYS